jgi:hypothetical protein
VEKNNQKVKTLPKDCTCFGLWTSRTKDFKSFWPNHLLLYWAGAVAFPASATLTTTTLTTTAAAPAAAAAEMETNHQKQRSRRPLQAVSYVANLQTHTVVGSTVSTSMDVATLAWKANQIAITKQGAQIHSIGLTAR